MLTIFIKLRANQKNNMYFECTVVSSLLLYKLELQTLTCFTKYINKKKYNKCGKVIPYILFNDISH